MSGKFWIYLLCLAVPLLIACWVVAPPAMALTGVEYQITTNTLDQIDPAISGNYIVWTDSRNGNKDIYHYDIPSHKEAPLTPGTPNDQYLDDVDGVNVVYTNVKSSGSDIYVYNITAGQSTPLTSGGDQYFPAIQKDHVVWVAASDGVLNVWLADISAWTLTKVTTDPITVAAPRVDGDWVVWEEVVGTSWQIRAYQISTGQTRDITPIAANHRRPDVSGDLVVWSDDYNGNWDLYIYSFSSRITTRLTSALGNEQYPRISGRRVVWEDSRKGITQIWTINLDTDEMEAVSPSPHSQILNAIDGNRIVWTESRSGNYDIFMFTITPPPTCGDGTCTGAETCSSCSSDCSVCPPPQPTCGDGTCTGAETCSSCSSDCGVCPNGISVDIEPGLCPNLIGLNMRGPVLIVAITGTKDLDAKKIDPATITLSREGIPGTVTPRYNKVLDIATTSSGPTFCSCQRKLWDGTKDLVLVFDIGEVVTNLQLSEVKGQTVLFVVKGSLKTEYGKTPLSGSDCMKVLSVSNERIWQNI